MMEKRMKKEKVRKEDNEKKSNNHIQKPS